MKLQKVLKAGKIGKVVSSTVLASASTLPTSGWPEAVEYYLDMKSGENEFFIFFGHCESDAFLSTYFYALFLTLNQSWIHLSRS